MDLVFIHECSDCWFQLAPLLKILELECCFKLNVAECDSITIDNFYWMSFITFQSKTHLFFKKLGKKNVLTEQN